MLIPPEVRAALVEHAQAEQPNECCGLIAFRDGVAERYIPARNAAASPYRFELDADPEVWFLEDEGYELAVFHSHLSSPPRPSRTDIENIGLWEGRPYVILTVSTRRARRLAHPRRQGRGSAALLTGPRAGPPPPAGTFSTQAGSKGHRAPFQGMTRRLHVLFVVVALAATVAACGGGESTPPAAPVPAEPAASDEVLSVDEALASTFGDPVRVTGFLVAQEGAAIRLCSALAESYPPQCGGASLVVEGLELASVEGLTIPAEPEYAHTSWTDTPVELYGVVATACSR